jgi:hypothetical protein
LLLLPLFNRQAYAYRQQLLLLVSTYRSCCCMCAAVQLYERVLKGGFPYFVNGAGGANLSDFSSVVVQGAF